MITPDDIKQKARRLYRGRFLTAWLAGEPFFPLTVPGNRGRSTDAYEKRLVELELLLGSAKSSLGYGYSVAFKNTHTRLQGRQSLPDRIYFETQADFLQFLGKEKEFRAFTADVDRLKNGLGERIGPWLLSNALQVIKHHGQWAGLISVCQYFLEHPKPGLYIRELPIDVHTKFIEANKAILTRLLDFLLLPAMIHSGEKQFERRYHLKYQEPLVRLRFLDGHGVGGLFAGVSDMALPVSQFAGLSPSCRTVFVVENQMNFLCFPVVSDSIVIWGRGFAADNLKAAAWLKEKPLVYWGDIDVHGFQILSLLRSHFPQVISLMMDEQTFTAFSEFAVTGPVTRVMCPGHLNSAELDLYRKLLDRCAGNRLEQEKLSHTYVHDQVERLFNN